MLEHEAVRRNLTTLRRAACGSSIRARAILACGWIGKGRLAEPDDIVDGGRALLLRPSGSLLGRRVLVTGRPDLRGHRSGALRRQPIERKDGLCDRRGGGAARRARRARVGPNARASRRRASRSCASAAPPRCTRAIVPHAADADVVVMAAAVADYTPDAARGRARSRKATAPMRPAARADGGHPRRARRGARRGRPARCWSASPPRAAIRSRAAAQKLQRKKVDLIVANDISADAAGFESDTNAVTIISADGEDTLPLAPKSQIAAAILDRAERLREGRSCSPALS